MKKTIFALGFFDGVHIGHAALLHDCRALAEAHKAAAGVATFGAHPEALVFGKAPSLISSPEDRQWLLVNRFGMDTVLTLPFDEQMMHMPWRAFLDMMRRDYGAVGFVCGEDFRFGFRGQGTALTLSDYCREAGLPCLTLTAGQEKAVRNGAAFTLAAAPGRYRLYGAGGEFLALGECREGKLCTLKSFFEV